MRVCLQSDIDVPIKEENEMAKVHVAMWYVSFERSSLTPRAGTVNNDGPVAQAREDPRRGAERNGVRKFD